MADGHGVNAVERVERAAYAGATRDEVARLAARLGVPAVEADRIVDAIGRAVERERVLDAWRALAAGDLDGTRERSYAGVRPVRSKGNTGDSLAIVPR